jgi:hypothetical protein
LKTAPQIINRKGSPRAAKGMEASVLITVKFSYCLERDGKSFYRAARHGKPGTIQRRNFHADTYELMD